MRSTGNYSLIRAWVNTIIISILGFSIFYIYFKTYVETNKYINIDADILDEKCTKVTTKIVDKDNNIINKKKTYDCLVWIEYKVNNKLYKNKIKITKLEHKPILGKKIKIKYNKHNPKDIIYYSNTNSKLEGIIGMTVITVLLFFTYLNLYLVLCN